MAGDLYVHTRLKECCRATLAKLDVIRKVVALRHPGLILPSLADTLGNDTVPRAMTRVPPRPSQGLDQVPPAGRDASAKYEATCKEHAELHRGANETEEANLWLALLGMGVTGRLAPVAAVDSSDAKGLAAAADDALKKHPDACNQSTAAAAKALGHDELEGKTANEQIDYMTKKWQTVDAAKAKELAGQGKLVIAGHEGSTHGHTAIVVPGSGETKSDGNFYPNVQGGALGGVSSPGYSDGKKTAGDVWNSKDRKDVKYYTP